jgi:hypothetical protein
VAEPCSTDLLAKCRRRKPFRPVRQGLFPTTPAQKRLLLRQGSAIPRRNSKVPPEARLASATLGCKPHSGRTELWHYSEVGLLQ